MTQDATLQARSGNAITAGVTERNILEDIRYFEARLQRSTAANDSHARAMSRVYSSLLAHRRQMLVALRDGRPDAWYEYEHVVV